MDEVDKLSVTALQAHAADRTPLGILLDTWPMLLEVTAAALAFVKTQGDRTEPEWGDLTRALSKWRP